MPALAELFKGVLENAVGSHAVIFDYGNSVDFGRLWDAGKGTPAVLSDLNGKRAAVIVWDGRVWNENDHDEKCLTPHLTPLDWALAFSIKMLGDSIKANGIGFHIHIVDLTGKAHDEWAMRMRYQLLAEMPWVTLHAPLIPVKNGEVASYRQGYYPILGDGGLLISESGAWQLNKKGITLAAGSNQGCGKDLVGLAKCVALREACQRVKSLGHDAEKSVQTKADLVKKQGALNCVLTRYDVKSGPVLKKLLELAVTDYSRDREEVGTTLNILGDCLLLIIEYLRAIESTSKGPSSADLKKAACRMHERLRSYQNICDEVRKLRTCLAGIMKPDSYSTSTQLRSALPFLLDS